MFGGVTIESERDGNDVRGGANVVDGIGNVTPTPPTTTGGGTLFILVVLVVQVPSVGIAPIIVVVVVPIDGNCIGDTAAAAIDDCF
jgi:hypothetical protein